MHQEEDGDCWLVFARHDARAVGRLDVIECFTEPGKSLIQGEVLMKQEQLYRELGVRPLLANPEASVDSKS